MWIIIGSLTTGIEKARDKAFRQIALPRTNYLTVATDTWRHSNTPPDTLDNHSTDTLGSNQYTLVVTTITPTISQTTLTIIISITIVTISTN